MPRRRNTLTRSITFVNRAAVRMGLHTVWRIEVEQRPEIRGSHADIDWVGKRATLRLNAASMAEMSPSQWEHILLHELCHLFIADIEDWAHRNFKCAGTLGASYRHPVEGICDALATLLQKTWSRKERVPSAPSKTSTTQRGTSTTKTRQARSAKRSTAPVSRRSRSRARRS